MTDANLILGYVPADYFLGGEMKLDADASRRAMKPLAERSGMNEKRPRPKAIFRTVNANMANKITEVSTKRGYDIRNTVMIAGGGGGPIHAGFIAETLGIRKVVVPPVAALYSAFGMFAMDIGQDYARSFVGRVASIDLDALNRRLRGNGGRGCARRSAPTASIPKTSCSSAPPTCAMSASSTRSRAEMPNGKLGRKAVDAAADFFARKHEELYTFAMPWKAVEILTLRLKASTPNAPFALPQVAQGGADPAAALQTPAQLPLQRPGRRYPGLRRREGASPATSLTARRSSRRRRPPSSSPRPSSARWTSTRTTCSRAAELRGPT